MKQQCLSGSGWGEQYYNDVGELMDSVRPFVRDLVWRLFELDHGGMTDENLVVRVEAMQEELFGNTMPKPLSFEELMEIIRSSRHIAEFSAAGCAAFDDLPLPGEDEKEARADFVIGYYGAFGIRTTIPEVADFLVKEYAFESVPCFPPIA